METDWGIVFLLTIIGLFISISAICGEYQPRPVVYIVLFFLFAGPMLIVFSFIPLLIVRRATRNKPVIPGHVLAERRKRARARGRHLSIDDDCYLQNDESSLFRKDDDWRSDPAYSNFIGNIYHNDFK